LVFDEDGGLDSNLTLLDEAYGGVSEELLDTFQGNEDTHVTKLYKFIQKEELPPNAVYVSEEKPPQDKQGRVTVPVYETEHGADYWIRTLQPTDEEEEVAAPPKDYELSKVTEDYIDRYSLAMQDGYEDFNKKVNDPSTPEYARMTDLVHLFVDKNFDKKRQKGLAGYSNPLELLTALADGGYKELSKPTSTSLFKIATTKTRGPKKTYSFVVNPKTGNRDIPINPLNPKAKVVFGGTDHQRGAYNAHATGNHEINPEALLQVLESFITSRFPGNDGFDIPSWHLDNINELWMNGRIKEVKTHKAGIKGTLAGEALRGLPKAFYATNEYNNDKPIWLMPREEIERLTEEKDKGNISQLELDAMVEPIKEEPLNAQWVTIYNANHQYPPQSREKNEPLMVEGMPHPPGSRWSPERKQQRARQRFDGANTVIHEMSHQLWNGEHCKQWMKATVLKEYLRALEEDKGFPSQYAKISNEHEFFSECYTAYVMHTKAFKERNPKMAELMENFFKGKPESRDLTDEEADLLKNRDKIIGEWEQQFKSWQKEDSDYSRHRLSLKEPRITKEAEEDDEEHIPEIIQDTFQIGKFNPAAANISMGDTEINPDWFTPVDDEETEEDDATEEEDDNDTAVNKLSKFIQKVLPPTAVYVSEEAPPEGTPILDGGAFGGRQGTQIWFRTPTQDKPELPDDVQAQRDKIQKALDTAHKQRDIMKAVDNEINNAVRAFGWGKDDFHLIKEQLEKDTTKAIQTLINKPETAVWTRVPEASMKKILSDGSFKTAHETGKTSEKRATKGGKQQFYLDHRKRIETNSFGEDANPFYAYLSDHEEGKLREEKERKDKKISRTDKHGVERRYDDIAHHYHDKSTIYGNMRVKLKPHIKQKTTLTAGDSYDHYDKNYHQFMSDIDYKLMPELFSNLAKLQIQSGLMPKNFREGFKTGMDAHFSRTPEEKEALNKGFEEFKSKIENGEIKLKDLATTYIEAQIHGGLSVDDIEEIVIDYKWNTAENKLDEDAEGNPTVSPQLLKQLDKLGIKWRFGSKSTEENLYKMLVGV